MKSLKLALLGMLAAGTAFAGNVVYVAPEVVAIEEPMRAGIGAWLIPLAIIAIVALALTGNDDYN